MVDRYIYAASVRNSHQLADADAVAGAAQLDYARGEKLIEICPPVNREVIRRIFKLGEHMAKRPGFSLRAMSAGLYACTSLHTWLLSLCLHHCVTSICMLYAP